ncbi:MAG TPA: hypothetical protein VGL66_06565 [Caulobacteraceae bacterium]|jgi:hypothetical protein
MTKILFAGACALALCACATSNIVGGSSSTYGIGAQTLPDGTFKGSIGATTADFVTVPLDRSKGVSNPYEVPTMCGGKDAVSTYGTIGGVASAGAGTTTSAAASTKPGIALSLNRGLATGEPARLLALAELQQANTTINAMHEYHNCSQVTPPTAAPAAGS